VPCLCLNLAGLLPRAVLGGDFDLHICEQVLVQVVKLSSIQVCALSYLSDRVAKACYFQRGGLYCVSKSCRLLF
jgi:hypothetical protein